jgi:hypothetical protein
VKKPSKDVGIAVMTEPAKIRRASIRIVVAQGILKGSKGREVIWPAKIITTIDKTAIFKP